MKRLLTTLIMLCYMANAIGMSFSMHYCGGSFRQVCFTADTEKNCCGEGEKSGCCKDHFVKAKFKDDHTPKAFTLALKIPAEAIAKQQFGYTPEPFLIYQEEVHIAHGPSPPLLQEIPIYILVRNLRI